MMLTKRQAQLFGFISERIRSSGVCPSYVEMAAAIGLKSKSNIHRILAELEERGFIRWIKGLPRSIEVLRQINDDPRDRVVQAARAFVESLSASGPIKGAALTDLLIAVAGLSP